MTDLTALAERVWYGTDAGPRLAGALLAPLSGVYGAVSAMRGALYHRGVLASATLVLPSVSVGNLSVGGTGKTPVAAWVARELLRRGERAAVVLRGYGGDEPLVHAALNPQAVVIADADRIRGVERARAAGATVAVLDDAFQHRGARRDVDIVLVSADRWTGDVRLLPAGPFREPLRALGRATVSAITCKAASPAQVAATVAAVRACAPSVPVVVLRLSPRGLCAWQGHGDETRPPASLRGAAVLAVSAIGDPSAFEAQLGALGARVTARRFPDHHAFSAADAGALARAAERGGLVALCTLKDAVKLGPLWPRGVNPLWYVSQRVDVESGAGELERAIGAALRSRRS